MRGSFADDRVGEIDSVPFIVAVKENCMDLIELNRSTVYNPPLEASSGILPGLLVSQDKTEVANRPVLTCPFSDAWEPQGQVLTILLNPRGAACYTLRNDFEGRGDRTRPNFADVPCRTEPK